MSALRVTACKATVVSSELDPGDNEDRVAAAVDRFALADGVSSSVCSGRWAELLVLAWVQQRVDPLDLEVLAVLRDQWTRDAEIPGPAWFVMDALERGSAATFVAMEMLPDSRRVAVSAVGDACFFHIRAGRILQVGPVVDWRKFTSRTRAIHTDREPDVEDIWRLTVSYDAGDVFVLASDALACWVLEHVDSLEGLLNLTREPEFETAFVRWVEHERENGRLRDDDTTVCVVST
ncbi:PP2C family serine/threonine-protein phosphatase [Nocardia heshunensis]